MEDGCPPIIASIGSSCGPEGTIQLHTNKSFAECLVRCGIREIDDGSRGDDAVAEDEVCSELSGVRCAGPRVGHGIKGETHSRRQLLW